MKESYQDYYRKNRRGKSSLLAKLMLPITWPLGQLRLMFVSIANAFTGGSRKLSSTSPLKLLHWLVLLPFNIGRSIVSSLWILLSGWTATRERKALLFGLPALLFAALTIGLMFFNEYYMKGRLLNNYEVAAEQAIKLEEYDSAMIYLEKLIDLDSNKDKYRYQMATVYYAKGDGQQGERTLNNIAPTEKAGYPQAHLILAKNALVRAQKADAEDREQELVIARTHLDHAIMREPQNVQALHQAAVLASRTDRMKDAAGYMRSASMYNPDLLLDAALLQRAIGQEKDARLMSRQYIDYLNRSLEDKPLRRWYGIARAHFFLEQYPETVAAVEKSIKATENAEERKRLLVFLAEAHSKWASSIRNFRDNPAQFAERLRHLERALQIYPRSTTASSLLAEMAFVDSDHADQLNSLLRNALVNGKASATVHMLLGTSAIKAGKIDSALVHLRQAQKLAPNTVEVLNNLAWLNADKEQPDLPLAEELIESAMAIASDNYHIRHTRGTIMMKAGKMKEALADLEFALPSMSDNAKIHDQLSEVYAKLGELELSVQHDAVAKRLREKEGL